MTAVDQLAFQTGPYLLLSGVSFQLTPGTVTSVIGPNGAGKSTLLKCLASHHRPTSGSIRINGKNLGDWAPKDLARWRGVLPQSSRVPFDFRVMEVVLLGRAPHIRGIESAHDRAIARAALTRTGVIHLENRIVNSLSGGEFQRVQFARVLCQIWEATSDHNRILLLDEPTSSLDLHHQIATMEIARSFAREGAAVLVILHDLNLAAHFSDQILVLNSGRQVALGSPADVLTPALIESVFQVHCRIVGTDSNFAPSIVFDYR